MLNVISGSGDMERDVKDESVMPRYREGSTLGFSPGLTLLLTCCQSCLPGFEDAAVVRTTIGCGMPRITSRTAREWVSALEGEGMGVDGGEVWVESVEGEG